ncbi:MAG: sensor histidine kinase [Deltaproteobacteria bacterium]|nr:MAG: sensor histidine kinase [Deltaproteobacteria bacterium]
MSTLKARCESVRSGFEIADIGFFLLRLIALAGTVGWLLVAPVPPETVSIFLWIAGYFLCYGVLGYALLFHRFDRKRDIYRILLLFDLAFVYLLIVHSGGFASSFFLGFYLLTALHSFYYGYRTGLATAAACAAIYFLAGVRVSAFEPIDFMLHISFLFLIALPIGLLSTILRADKEKIESLNRDLAGSLATMKDLQGKIMEVEKLSALGRLTANVAHEIRNPLTAIGGFAKRLEKRLPETTPEKEYAKIVVNEVARLERILRDTLTFSREAKYHLQYADMNRLLARTEAEFGEICREKRVHILGRPAPGLPPCIVDEDQIRQALDNLVTNAIDAMPDGGTLTVATRTACENGTRYVVIDVSDTGPGISADLVNRIFEPFYSTKEVGHGTGLGLSICKKIMEEHHGEIRVSAAPEGGTTFSLLIPHLPAEETFKPQCWEFMRCGMDKIENAAGRCPAFPNYGRICWSVAGTFSGTKVHCTVPEKVGDCRKCPFYEFVEPSCP